MRVALFAHLSEVSGAGTALLQIAAGLASRFEPTVVLPGEGPLTVRARQMGLRVVVLPTPEHDFASISAGGRLRLVRQRWAYVRAVGGWLRAGKYDVAYINSVASIFAGAGARCARCPIVWHVHETIERPSLVQRLKLWYIGRSATGLLYASESAARGFPPRVRHCVVRNPLNWAALEGAAPADWPGEGRRLLRILANGAFRRKAPDVLVEALALLRRAHPELAWSAAVAGAPAAHEREFLSQVQRRAADLGLAESIHWLGLRNDFPALLRAADVFVSPSRNEAMPIAIVEALALGVPVVGTDTGDTRRLLRAGEFGWVVPVEDPVRLADALAAALADRDEARRRAGAGRAAIREDYAPEQVLEPIESLIEQCHAHPRRLRFL